MFSSNLQRQLLYTEEDARGGLPKAEAARRHLLAANCAIRIEACVSELNPEDAEELLGCVQVILDGTDNFETRLLMNDYVGAGKRSLDLRRGGGQLRDRHARFCRGTSACFRCIYPEPPSGAPADLRDGRRAGTDITSLIGSIQAMEAMKILAGRAASVRRKIFRADLWNGPVPSSAREQCDARARLRSARPADGGSFRFERRAARAPVSLCGRNAVQIHERSRPVNLIELAARLEGLGPVRANQFVLRFEDGEHEVLLCSRMAGRLLRERRMWVWRAERLFALCGELEDGDYWHRIDERGLSIAADEQMNA